jgi:hypothetical protein
MSDKSLSDLADSTLREQKAAVLAAAAEIPDKKERYRKRVEQELAKQLRGWLDRMEGFRMRLQLLREDIESVNPRFSPIQLHTKTKWVNEVSDLIVEFDKFIFESEDPKITWEE